MSDRAFPIITAGDLPAACAFYEQLGFTQAYRFPPEGEAGFVTMQRGDSSIGIGAGGADEERFGYWVYVDDVDATLERLRAAGAPGRRRARGPAVGRAGRPHARSRRQPGLPRRGDLTPAAAPQPQRLGISSSARYVRLVHAVFAEPAGLRGPGRGGGERSRRRRVVVLDEVEVVARVAQRGEDPREVDVALADVGQPVGAVGERDVGRGVRGGPRRDAGRRRRDVRSLTWNSGKRRAVRAEVGVGALRRRPRSTRCRARTTRAAGRSRQQRVVDRRAAVEREVRRVVVEVELQALGARRRPKALNSSASAR